MLKEDSNEKFLPFFVFGTNRAAAGGEVMINPNLHVSSDGTVSCSNTEAKLMNEPAALIRWNKVTGYGRDSCQR